MNYYNEHDKKAAAWIRELIKAGMIAPGEVDERSIVDVKANELAGYTQCHFFAGIGGWSYALRLARWADARAVWTGSCPCQPFSSAGKGRGEKDHRHLWPEFSRLISECKPSTVFGEQVASPAGRKWFSGVRTNLETMGYAVGAADLCAAGVGSPHIRQRLFWVADAERERWGGRHNGDPSGMCRQVQTEGRSTHYRLADTEHYGSCRTDGFEAVENCNGKNGRIHHGNTIGVGHAALPEGTRQRQFSKQLYRSETWSHFDIIECRDEKARRIESGTFPLAHGIPGRVGLLRGYGNAIVPEVAAEFIRSFGI